MRSPAGLLFGDRIWVGIEVVPYPTATPPPTQTPSPSIQFSANPTSINEGECSTLTWNTSNVQAVYLYPQGEDWRNYGVPGVGRKTRAKLLRNLGSLQQVTTATEQQLIEAGATKRQARAIKETLGEHARAADAKTAEETAIENAFQPD